MRLKSQKPMNMKNDTPNFIQYLSRKRHARRALSICVLLSLLAVTGCGDKKKEFVIPTEQGTRDNTSVCLTTEAPGTLVFEGEGYLLDYSNASEGYICAKYTGTSPKVKFQITLPNRSLYTYNLTDQLAAFPLSSESGTYGFGIYENMDKNQYSTLMFEEAEITIENEFGAYLYPNQYVDFEASDPPIALGEELAFSANNDLDVVSNVYNYIICNIAYDKEEAESVQSGYLPDINDTLENKKGICLDYSALMASILRSQRIPTHMEVGYAGSAYHAWISTYITDIGWVNGIIQFDGTDWELMDPTFGASTGEKKLKQYIGDGANYKTKYIY